jgi:hypothetical protein
MVQTSNIKHWRIEVNDPRKSIDWCPLWWFDEEYYMAHQDLVDELNRINAPIQLRVAPDTD